MHTTYFDLFLKREITSIRVVFIAAFLVIHFSLCAQNEQKLVFPPQIKDFSPTLSFLSSNWMEGREAGERGGLMAADYMASMMQHYGLIPYGDSLKSLERSQDKQSYFQNFTVIKQKIETSSLALVHHSATSESVNSLTQGLDYLPVAGLKSVAGEAAVVFVGYGLSLSDKTYDDYKGLDVKGKIVLILKGFPGHANPTSHVYKNFEKALGEDGASMELKLSTAQKNGALAVILMDGSGSFEAFDGTQKNINLFRSVMNAAKDQEEDYDDGDYHLSTDTDFLPYFQLSTEAGKQLLKGTDLNLKDFEEKLILSAIPESRPLKNKVIRFSIQIKKEALLVRNVMGIIPGKDPDKSIVIGGHYDHLGIRGTSIYNGSDDNASGAAGVLALAKKWTECGIQPDYNLIFASWTAEEKGLLGSQYFAEHLQNPQDFLLYINMDMISRSILEDTAHRQLSVGTRTSDETLRDLAKKSNATLTHPFDLDLWDVTGHWGSDYASFTSRNIPIMTYNTGLHNDYHTPRDISIDADLIKMEEVLKLVNNSIQVFMKERKIHILPEQR